ncbi:hypothetical protein FIU97_06935 [Roseivivax sp. THAF40]|uniref:DUF1045 domain-containing protein n=1 Tax=unclassified Roseivivax TaxID=2639302 RepID=UPI001267DAA6|nr:MULTISPECIES: DUF1045 domain-containing protein [unclassified Roseivivax]QFS82539.1 hypothetical protein FIV09_06835 [Roseivivax sp. THAF197b]QFT46308.1 hypothetical protein FIU97_06935 [Roseivivax sp. THAF40]
MTSYARYALYYLPPEGALAEFGARWLGWDAQAGVEAPLYDLDGLDAMTAGPRKYGFHATLKPPFRLALGRSQADLEAAIAELAGRTAQARADGLKLARLGRFLALVADGDSTGIDRIAAACVTDLDAFRAPMDVAERARRQLPHLTAHQQELLARWGYPQVLDAFRFHMTLTGRLNKSDLARAEAALPTHLPDLPAPFVLDAVTLLGERPDGRFERIARFLLTA